MTFEIIHWSPSNTGCLFIKCQWQRRAFRFLGRESMWQGIFNRASASFPYMLSLYLGLQLPEFLQFIWAALHMKGLLFLSHTTETFPSKANEKSPCSLQVGNLVLLNSWCSCWPSFLKNLVLQFWMTVILNI